MIRIVDTNDKVLNLTVRQLNELLSAKPLTWKQLLKAGKMPIIRANFEWYGESGDPTLNYFKTASIHYQNLKAFPVSCNLETRELETEYQKAPVQPPKRMTNKERYEQRQKEEAIRKQNLIDEARLFSQLYDDDAVDADFDYEQWLRNNPRWEETNNLTPDMPKPKKITIITEYGTHECSLAEDAYEGDMFTDDDVYEGDMFAEDGSLIEEENQYEYAMI